MIWRICFTWKKISVNNFRMGLLPVSEMFLKIYILLFLLLQWILLRSNSNMLWYEEYVLLEKNDVFLDYYYTCVCALFYLQNIPHSIPKCIAWNCTEISRFANNNVCAICFTWKLKKPWLIWKKLDYYYICVCALYYLQISYSVPNCIAWNCSEISRFANNNVCAICFTWKKPWLIWKKLDYYYIYVRVCVLYFTCKYHI